MSKSNKPLPALGCGAPLLRNWAPEGTSADDQKAVLDAVDQAMCDGVSDDADAAECKGHPAGSHGVMGETTYCDGSCRQGRGPLDFDPFASTSAAPPPRPRLKGTGPRSLNRDDAAVAERDNRVMKGGR